MNPFSLFFVFQFLSISILTTIHPISTQNLIDSSCKNFARSDPNIHYTFCTTSLQAVPASGRATLRGLGSISVQLVRYNLTDTRRHIKHLLKNTELNPYLRQCLKDCLELYSDAVLDVKQAMNHYNEKKFDDANVKMSAIMDTSTTCEDGFKERAGVGSPLTKRNHDVFELSAVMLSIMSAIRRRSG